MKRRTQKEGKVFLVGAGPGDPGLLTLRARALLESADVVIHDWLVSEGVLKHAARAKKMDMGKHPLRRGRKIGALQDAINRELVRQAKSGKTVVRLKGGDPLVFGRGGEEALFLKKNHIPFEFVPGVSAGYAVPEYAGIPVTDRRWASQVTFVTGHEDPLKNESSVNWKKLAGLSGTIVSFMGVRSLPRITKLLSESGMNRKTPVSVIEWGTLPGQRVAGGTLESIAGEAERKKIGSPALVVIGEVNRLRQELSWFEKKPLFGKTVLITRARDQASRLRMLLEEKGACVVEFPAIRILPPASWKTFDLETVKFKNYDWVVFTSVNGVDFVFDRLSEKGKDARVFAGAKIAVIGEATSDALKAKGLLPDLMPPAFHSRSLFAALKKKEKLREKKILLLRTDLAPEELRQSLEGEGAHVNEITVYRTRPDLKAAGELRRWMKNHAPDFITFTSASTVRYFFEALGPLSRKLEARLLSIGPMTSEALRARGVSPFREAKIHTLEGLLQAISEAPALRRKNKS